MEVGTALGPYVIDRELGSGGMGKVYAATLRRAAAGLPPGTVVAVKVVYPHLLETEGFFKRFLREARIGQSVTHENVVRTLDSDQLVVRGQVHAYLVMEYVEGQTLADLQDELERVPEELCRHVGREICKGLAAIHAAGVVHRDLKPDNVLITGDHKVKVMDLGVARLADEQMRLSRTGLFVGSVEYAAPEQFAGGHLDARCDLHALGLLLYELSCGRHPYRADDFRAVMMRVCEDEPRRLGEIHPQLSPFFEDVVHTLLEKNPDDRLGSAAEVLRVLVEGEDSAWWKERAKALRAATKRPLRRIFIPRETAVYGREPEIARLRELYERARGGAGQAVLVEGEAGIGKSRLVDELIGRLRADGDDLNFLFGSYPPGGAATAAGAFSSAYREHFGEAGSAEYLEPTPLLVPGFDAVLRGEPAPRGEVELSGDSLGTCFVHATRRLAEGRTTVVLIEDLHFAPEEARRLFTTLALAVPGHRVLLIGTTRPGVPEEWVTNLCRLDHLTHVGLARLGPKDLGALLEDSFGSQALAQELGYQIVTKSDGNPFFVFEIIRGLREGNLITQRDDGSWVSTGVIGEIRVPSSVLDLVNARVAGMSEEERELLDAAACWGFEFDATLVGDCLGLARVPTLRQLALIEKRERLVRCVGERFVFDHHQVQEALYAALPPPLAREYHAALAAGLEARKEARETDPETLHGTLCVDLCEHFLRGAQGERALRYLRAAQTHLAEGYLHAEVTALTERALSVPGLLIGVERAKALLRLCNPLGPLDLMGRRTRQEEYAREAERLAEEAGDDQLGGQAATALGTVCWRTSRHEEAEAAYRRALARSLARGDRTAEAHLMGRLGIIFRAQGRLDEARVHHERHLEISREIGDRHAEAAAMGNLGLVVRSQGRAAEAREYVERSLALSRELGDRVGESIATGNLGLVLKSEGRLAEARRYNERSLALSREIGDREGEALDTGNLGALLRAEGRLREAREQFERHLALSREVGSRRGETIALQNLGDVLAEEGESERAEERLAACLSLSDAISDRHGVALTHLELGILRAAAGDHQGAGEFLAAARDLASEIGVPSVETLARCHLARLPGGDPQDALAAFTENEERIDREERREVRFLLWEATGDATHLAEAKRLLDESVAHVDDETRTSMLTNLRLNRDIMAAWAEHGSTYA